MQFISPKAVCAKVAISRSTLSRLVATGEFPMPITLSERRLAFDLEEIEKWMAERHKRTA